MPKLHSTVYVDGIGYGPDSDVPPAIAKRIADHAWEGGEAPKSRKKAESAETQDGPPPMSGKGSGLDEWRAYADRLGVLVAAEAKREDIVAALRAAGHQVEPTA